MMVLAFVKRSVSPIRYDSAPILSEDIVCPGSEDEDDDKGERNRRIEALATQYLQGRGLFIQSASLKGPLETGWKNPWAKRRKRKRDHEDDLQVYSDTRDAQAKHTPSPAGKYVESSTTKRQPDVFDAQAVDTEAVSNALQVHKLAPGSEKSIFKKARQGGKSDVAQQVQQPQNTWLKGRIDNLGPFVEDREASPTPTPMARDMTTTNQGTLNAKTGQAPRKRLSPYTSSVTIDKASSKYAAKKAANSARPSPRVLPPSTTLPEFRYRKAGRDAKSSPVTQGNAPKNCRTVKGRSRADSLTSSSSGSTAFAEALEAAQAEAASAALSSSLASSRNQAKESAESLRTTHILERKIISEPTSRPGNRRPSQDRSAKAPSKNEKVSQRRNDLLKGSESLADAQIVPDAPMPIVPSGSSTNPLETEQPIRVSDIDEGDSFMNLSTQGAILKAHKSFQTALEDSPETSRADAEGFKVPPKLSASEVGDAFTKTIDPALTSLRPADVDGQTQAMPTTQALLESFSPFTVSTVKKRPPRQYPPKKRASFAPDTTSPVPTRNRIRNATPGPSDAVAKLNGSGTPTPTKTSFKSLPPLFPTTVVTSSNKTSFSNIPNGSSSEHKKVYSNQHSSSNIAYNDDHAIPDQDEDQDGQQNLYFDQEAQIQIPPPQPSAPLTMTSLTTPISGTAPDFDADAIQWPGGQDDHESNSGSSNGANTSFKWFANQDHHDGNEASESRSSQRSSVYDHDNGITALEADNEDIDVNAAIEEAGQFLEAWDVEREAKIVGSSQAIARPALGGASPNEIEKSKSKALPNGILTSKRRSSGRLT